MNAEPIPFPALDASFASASVKFRGVPFEYGDRILIVPPLPLARAEAASRELGTEPPPEDAAAREAWTNRRFELMQAHVVLALRRNYPESELTAADVSEFVTLDNLHAASGRGADTTSHRRGLMRPDIAVAVRASGDFVRDDQGISCPIRARILNGRSVSLINRIVSDTRAVRVDGLPFLPATPNQSPPVINQFDGCSVFCMGHTPGLELCLQ